MKIFENYSLLKHNTFGIDQKCDVFYIYESKDDAIRIAQLLNQSIPLILGGGSNVLLAKDVNGAVVTAEKRFDVQIVNETVDEVWLRCWAGTCFDDFVQYACEHGYYGLENLSLIPGECGASAIQNIGAYGVEAKDYIVDIEAIDLLSGQEAKINNSQCEYAYRYSKFKSEWKNRFLITHVTYKLKKSFVPRLQYGNIIQMLETKHIEVQKLSAIMFRDLIIEIRQQKLPDPQVLGNAGSFFMNPIVDKKTLELLQLSFPQIKYFEMPVERNDDAASYKIPAAWLIQSCGWKGKRVGHVGVYEKQALVLVNYGQASGSEVIQLMKNIQEDVYNKFGIHIYPEVNIIA